MEDMIEKREGNGEVPLIWLNRHVEAFAHAWNQRQLHNRARPFDKKHVIDFVYLRNYSLP